MTIEYEGRLVTRPAPKTVGTYVTADVPANATTLPVKQCGMFNDEGDNGGFLRLRFSDAADPETPASDVIVAYVDSGGPDGEDDVVELAAGYPSAIPTGTSVDVWDPVTGSANVFYEAEFLPDDADEPGAGPLEAIVHGDLMDTLTSETLPGPGERVLLREDDKDGVIYITRVLGGALVRDLSYVDVDTAPPGLGGDTGPTEPPATSPALAVTGLPSSLVLRLTEPLESGARVQYHLSATDGFTPDPSTAVGPLTAAGVYIADSLPDGTPLAAGTTYYARAVATNDIGSAAPSAQSSGALNLDAIRTVVAAELVAGFILAGRIQIGQAYIDADEGFVVPNPDGTQSVIPFDGSPIDLVAMVTALSLTVTGSATFLGLVRYAARGMLNDGVTAPGTAPEVTSYWPSVDTGLVGYGLVERIGDTSQWATTRVVPIGGSHRVQLVSVAKSNGQFGSVIGTLDAGVSNSGGVTVIGSRYYVLAQSSASAWRVYVLESDGSLVMSWDVATSFGGRPAIGTDGTRVLIAHRTTGDALRVAAHSTAGALAEATLFLPNGSYTSDTAGIRFGSVMPYGTRIVVQPADGNGMVWSGSIGSPTRQAGEDYPRALNTTIRGLAYDSALIALTSTGQVARHGAQASRAINVAHSWAGVNGGGATIETQPGPTRTYTTPNLTFYIVTVGTPPEAVEADPNRANRAAIYTALAGQTLRRSALLGIGGRTYFNDTTAGIALPVAQTTNGFAAISAPGTLVPERGATDSVKRWLLSGAGSGKVGGLSWTVDGVNTIDTDLAGKIVALVQASSVGTGVLRDSVLAAVKTAVDTTGNALRTSVVDAVRASYQMQTGSVSTGTFTAANTPRDVTVTFPTPYPTGTVPTVNAWFKDVTGGVQVLCPPSINSVTRTGFTIRVARNNGTGAVDMGWEAKLT